MDKRIREAERVSPEEAQRQRCRAGDHDWSRAHPASFTAIASTMEEQLLTKIRACKACLQVDLYAVWEKYPHWQQPNASILGIPLTGVSSIGAGSFTFPTTI